MARPTLRRNHDRHPDTSVAVSGQVVDAATWTPPSLGFFRRYSVGPKAVLGTLAFTAYAEMFNSAFGRALSEQVGTFNATEVGLGVSAIGIGAAVARNRLKQTNLVRRRKMRSLVRELKGMTSELAWFRVARGIDGYRPWPLEATDKMNQLESATDETFRKIVDLHGGGKPKTTTDGTVGPTGPSAYPSQTINFTYAVFGKGGLTV
jgi:hypothetical protein